MLDFSKKHELDKVKRNIILVNAQRFEGLWASLPLCKVVEKPKYDKMITMQSFIYD